MPAEALALALTAAVIHAVWNTLLAGARDSQAFAAVVLVVGAVAGAPVAAFWWRLDDGVWPYLAATSALELLYFALLAFAYTHAELSVVYPLARGLAPVLVLVGVVVFTGAACAIAAYTVVDKHGVVHASPVTYLELMTVFSGAAYVAVLVARRGLEPLSAELGWRSVGAGIGTFVAYALVLRALQLASAASVAAVRESGVLVATALAAILLRERVTAWRAAGAALVVAGIVLLSL